VFNGVYFFVELRKVVVGIVLYLDEYRVLLNPLSGGHISTAGHEGEAEERQRDI
jgi:hypothetical protein